MNTALISLDAPVDGVATLTLTRADRKNALSIALRNQMSDALDDLARDEAVRVVLITGAGDAFSASFDLGEFTIPELADSLWASSDRWHRTLLEAPPPIGRRCERSRVRWGIRPCRHV